MNPVLKGFPDQISELVGILGGCGHSHGPSPIKVAEAQIIGQLVEGVTAQGRGVEQASVIGRRGGSLGHILGHHVKIELFLVNSDDRAAFDVFYTLPVFLIKFLADSLVHGQKGDFRAVVGGD